MPLCHARWFEATPHGHAESVNTVTRGHVLWRREIVMSHHLTYSYVAPLCKAMSHDVATALYTVSNLSFSRTQFSRLEKYLGITVPAGIKARISFHKTFAACHLATSLLCPYNEEREEDLYNCHAFRMHSGNVKETFNFLPPHFPEHGWQRLVAEALSKSEAQVFRTRS